MRQLTLHVSDEVAKMSKARAKAAGKSLSSYLAGLVLREVSVSNDWPERFFEEVVGGWKGKPLRRPNQGRF
jgi:hypothetical protein